MLLNFPSYFKIEKMKKYTIKYETFNKDVKVVEKYGYSKEYVKSQLINCKEIYWIK